MLSAIIGCSLIVMFAYESLNKNFNSNSIAYAKIAFVSPDNETHLGTDNSRHNWDTFESDMKFFKEMKKKTRLENGEIDLDC